MEAIILLTVVVVLLRLRLRRGLQLMSQWLVRGGIEMSREPML